MLGSKKFEKTILRLTIIILIFSLIVVCFPNIFSWISKDDIGKEYPIKLFGRDVINIEISADENDWNSMIENKNSKPYISCNLKIDGRNFNNVGLRPKGNSSLMNAQNGRVSFRLDFDHYVENQSCYGLEQMVLNNLQADATYMKDYIAYDLMEYVGVKAPLHTFAFITLNGKPFGVYLAAEVYDEDYLVRTYNDTNVRLYNVKSSGFNDFENAIVDPENGTVIESKGIEKSTSMGLPGGPGMPTPPPGGMGGRPTKGGQAPMPRELLPDSEQMSNAPDLQDNTGNNSFENMPSPPGGPGGPGGGGDLVYVDDSTDSYNTIFANAVSKYADAKDFAKVIKAIKYLNKDNVTNEELETYWDIDSILRYLAVHTFMVNGDSYTGGMKQNYFLAEQNGKINVLPWDYNLSFGMMGGPGGPPGMPNANKRPSDAYSISTTENNETTEVINFAIDTPTIGVDMESRPLVSVLLSRDEYKEKYHNYLDVLTQYVEQDFINKLEKVEKKIYPYIEKETVSYFTPEEHKTAFDVLKKFLYLRSQSIQGQLSGEIPSETDEQENANLITADFSLSEMGSMGGPGGDPPPGMQGQNMQGGMMPPPPPGMNGNQNPGGMMPPPPPGMHGMVQEQDNTTYYIIILLSLLILCIVFIGAKLFKRNY